MDIAALDALDRALINQLQDSFPLEDRPFAAVAQRVGSDEATVLARLQVLRSSGILTRFGPLFHAERLGGGLTLAAMAVPEADFDRVATLVNAYPEVAHNYRRDHALNMWFVVATETPEQITAVLTDIAQRSGFAVLNMPKLTEYQLHLRFEV